MQGQNLTSTVLFCSIIGARLSYNLASSFCSRIWPRLSYFVPESGLDCLILFQNLASTVLFCSRIWPRLSYFVPNRGERTAPSTRASGAASSRSRGWSARRGPARSPSTRTDSAPCERGFFIESESTLSS